MKRQALVVGAFCGVVSVCAFGQEQAKGAYPYTYTGSVWSNSAQDIQNPGSAVHADTSVGMTGYKVKYSNSKDIKQSYDIKARYLTLGATYNAPEDAFFLGLKGQKVWNEAEITIDGFDDDIDIAAAVTDFNLGFGLRVNQMLSVGVEATQQTSDKSGGGVERYKITTLQPAVSTRLTFGECKLDLVYALNVDEKKDIDTGDPDADDYDFKQVPGYVLAKYTSAASAFDYGASVKVYDYNRKKDKKDVNNSTRLRTQDYVELTLMTGFAFAGIGYEMITLGNSTTIDQPLGSIDLTSETKFSPTPMVDVGLSLTAGLASWANESDDGTGGKSESDSNQFTYGLFAGMNF